jgi:hypothetical protein
VTDRAFQLVGIVHGSLGAAMLALLVLSAWLELRGERESFGAGLLVCSLFQLLQAGVGLALSSHYEGRLRRLLFLRSPSLGWWLERKEHLAIGAIALTWCALAAHGAALRASETQQVGYRRAARQAAWGAVILSFLSFSIGVVVAAEMTSMLG